MTRRIGIEAGQVDDGEFRIKALQLLRAGTDQELMHEQRVPGIFGDHPHADAVGEVGAAEQILGEQFAAFGMSHHVGIKHIEMGRAHRLVVVPPHLAFGVLVAHHELVAGRAAGMDAGAHHQGAVGGDMAFAAADRFLIERRRAEIVMHGLEIAEAVAGKARSAVGHECSK